MPSRRQLMPILLTVGVGVLLIIVLAMMGRIGWCECGRPFLVTLQSSSPHTSQHLFDPYTPSHLLHGVIFYWALRWGVFKRRWLWALLIAAVIDAGWEVLENTPMVIDRYRAATVASDYYGDSIANSVSDWLSAIAGFLLARRIGPWASLAVFLVLEIGCLLWIRDNLTLNVIMLLWPIDAIRQWQGR